MYDTCESRNLSITIARDFTAAYDFLSLPENFPQWASGLGKLRRTDAGWLAETPAGTMKVRFSESNAFGVLDHWVSPAAESVIYIPLRLVRNGTGCELTLTLFRQPGMTQEQFDGDAAWVMRDLQSAKRLLETR